MDILKAPGAAKKSQNLLDEFRGKVPIWIEAGGRALGPDDGLLLK